jgi:hypothetical protein
MPGRRRKRPLKVGDRVRDMLTGRVGEVEAIEEVDGLRQYSVAYDEAPQDEHLTTPATAGAQREEHLLEPENRAR